VDGIFCKSLIIDIIVWCFFYVWLKNWTTLDAIFSFKYIVLLCLQLWSQQQSQNIVSTLWFFSSVDPSGLLELPANVTEVCLHILSIHCLLKHVKFYIKIKHKSPQNIYHKRSNRVELNDFWFPSLSMDGWIWKCLLQFYTIVTKIVKISLFSKLFTRRKIVISNTLK
jgi:hypothetical protein